MVRIQFYSKANLDTFVGDMTAICGTVPGEVREEECCVVLTRQQFESSSTDLIELANDYNGRVVHSK